MIRIYERSSITRHTFGSMTDGTSGAALDLIGTGRDSQKFHSGVLRGVTVSCDSTNFDVSLRTKSDALADTPDEIYRVTGISKYRRDHDLLVGWTNNDSPKQGKLYMTLTNNDLVNAPETIEIEVHTDIPKRFSNNR